MGLYTPKVRRKIYLSIAAKLDRVAKLMANDKPRPHSPYVCDNLAEVLNKREKTTVYYYEMIRPSYFPEFYSFKPEFNECVNGWWLLDNEGMQARIACLLICAEMCMDDLELSK